MILVVCTIMLQIEQVLPHKQKFSEDQYLQLTHIFSYRISSCLLDMVCACISEQRIGHILFLSYILYTLDVTGQVNPSSLTTCLRLHYESLSLSLLSTLMISLKIRKLKRKTPGNREKLILTRKLFPETHERIT